MVALVTFLVTVSKALFQLTASEGFQDGTEVKAERDNSAHGSGSMRQHEPREEQYEPEAGSASVTAWLASVSPRLMDLRPLSLVALFGEIVELLREGRLPGGYGSLYVGPIFFWPELSASNCNQPHLCSSCQSTKPLPASRLSH